MAVEQDRLSRILPGTPNAHETSLRGTRAAIVRAQPEPRTSKKTNQDAEKTQERRPTRQSERTSDVKRTRFESSRRQGTTPRQASRSSSSSAGKAKAKGTLIPLPKPKTIKEGGNRGDCKARGKNATATSEGSGAMAQLEEIGE